MSMIPSSVLANPAAAGLAVGIGDERTLSIHVRYGLKEDFRPSSMSATRNLPLDAGDSGSVRSGDGGSGGLVEDPLGLAHQLCDLGLDPSVLHLDSFGRQCVCQVVLGI